VRSAIVSSLDDQVYPGRPFKNRKIFIMKTLKLTLLQVLLLAISFLGFSAQGNINNNDSLIHQFEISLKKGILDVWYPSIIDYQGGGYFSNMTYDLKIGNYQPKMLVTQSRQVWTSAQAGIFYNDTSYIKYARHGVQFLKNHMWDSIYGGFFNIRSRDGGYINDIYKNEKRAYGNAFAIYGLISYYNLTKDTAALNLAKKTFLWLEKYSHDREKSGYIDALAQDGTWLVKTAPSQNAYFQSLGWKDYNSSIHIMEAFTELYKVWPDKLVKNRLQEMFTLIRDKFVSPEGYLYLNFTEDWKLVSNKNLGEEEIRKRKGIDHITFGHDVETAFLLLEASYALGIENDTKTLTIAKKMVDHALANGFDNEFGGLFGEGYYIPGKNGVTILDKNAEWWVQAEGLNALLLMSRIFPSEEKYWNNFNKIWNYINTYLIDKTYGEWYILGLNYNPGAQKAPKASIWKANYHNGRALMNCIRLLENENEVANHFIEIKQM
jgi:mannobiose 2-epimerase